MGLAYGGRLQGHAGGSTAPPPPPAFEGGWLRAGRWAGTRGWDRGRRNRSAVARPPAPARRAGAQPTSRPRQVLSWSGSSGGQGDGLQARWRGPGNRSAGARPSAPAQAPGHSSPIRPRCTARCPPLQVDIVGTRTGAGGQVRQVRAARAPSSRAGRGRPRTPGAGGCSWSTLHSARGRCRAAVAAEDRGMPERRWRVTTGGGRGLFQIDVDDGRGFRPATTAEVDAALRQRELFGAADHPAMEVGRDARSGVGPRNQPAGLDGREEE